MEIEELNEMDDEVLGERSLSGREQLTGGPQKTQEGQISFSIYGIITTNLFLVSSMWQLLIGFLRVLHASPVSNIIAVSTCEVLLGFFYPSSCGVKKKNMWCCIHIWLTQKKSFFQP